MGASSVCHSLHYPLLYFLIIQQLVMIKMALKNVKFDCFRLSIPNCSRAQRQLSN